MRGAVSYLRRICHCVLKRFEVLLVAMLTTKLLGRTTIINVIIVCMQFTVVHCWFSHLRVLQFGRFTQAWRLGEVNSLSSVFLSPYPTTNFEVKTVCDGTTRFFKYFFVLMKVVKISVFATAQNIINSTLDVCLFPLQIIAKIVYICAHFPVVNFTSDF